MKTTPTVKTFLIVTAAAAGALILALAAGLIIFLRMRGANTLPAPTGLAPLPFEITDENGAKMHLVAEGPFLMGSDAEEGLAAGPEHSVTLGNFYMDVLEVSRARYRECVSAGKCTDPKNVPSVEGYYKLGNYPMAMVNWYQAWAYCEWRGARLPSEAEWEKAARGTDGRQYPWGSQFDAANVGQGYDLADGILEVGSFPQSASPYGLLDMAGSLWEWTVDPFAPYTGSQAGPENFHADFYVLRGGASYYGDPVSLSSWFRYASFPEDAENFIGFRCARSAGQ